MLVLPSIEPLSSRRPERCGSEVRRQDGEPPGLRESGAHSMKQRTGLEMLLDVLTSVGFSETQLEVLQQAARILEAKVKSEPIQLQSPTMVKEWLALQLAGQEREVFGVIYLDVQNR